MKCLRWIVAGALTFGLAILAAVSVRSQPSQQMLQHGFEGRDIIWQPGPSDAVYKEIAHRLTDETAHSGVKSELIQLQVQKGSFIYYTYPIGKAPITDELTVNLWLKANRPGIQVLCRVVLPRERDPKNPEQPLTLLLPGETYNLAGRWQQIAVRQSVKRLRDQEQLLTAELKHPILTADAYVDRVVLNLYGGPGETNVWTDDLEVGPLLDSRPVTPDTTTPGKQVMAQPAINQRATAVSLQGNRLLVNNQPFFMRAIRHTGTPLDKLRMAGFNTVWLDETTPPALIDDAASLGFMIVPSISPPPAAVVRGSPLEAQLTAANDSFRSKLAVFLHSDSVLAYYLGGNEQLENRALVSRNSEAFHALDPMRPVAVDVMDGLSTYASDVNLMLGMHRWPLMTGLELTSYRDWLTQRRRLARIDTFCWTWVQTHLDDWYTNLVYDRPGAGGFNEPVGPLPEQIRLMTYCAVGCGYRGVGFWSDRFLADSYAGRDRLLAMAILNQELQLLEPLLVAAQGQPTWIDTSKPEVKAALIRTNKALLVIPVWFGNGSQYVPGQGAVAELKITVPHVFGSGSAWEVSPGLVRSLKPERVTGGSKVTLHEFGLTGAVVFTSDLGPNGLVVQFQEQQRRMAPHAAQWAHEQAQEELAKVEKVQAELDEMGVKLPDGEQLLAKSRQFIEACAAQRRNGGYDEAYADAQRALRPLRILMRAQWERAARDLDNFPTASPYAVSFFTLPRYWKFSQEIRTMKPTGNVLSDGDFEMPMDVQPVGWILDNPTPLDAVVTKGARVTTEKKEGRQSLMLEMLPKPPSKPQQQAPLPPLALERSYIAIHSPAVKLPPGTDVQVTAWVKIPQKISSSVDGALVFDSAGGEPLAIRLTDAQKDWKKLTLYRRVPASGSINVSMVLTGIGRVYFDDVRIEPLGRLGGSSQASMPLRDKPTLSSP